MYYISENFNTAAQANGRHILVKALFNGERELTGDHLIDMTVTEATAASGGLTMGSTISNKLTLNLRMPEEPLSLEGGFVEPWVGFDGVDELCPIGKFNITKVESKDEFVTATIEAYDDFSKTEEEYVPTIELPAPPEAIVRDIASQKHLALEDSSGNVTGIGAVRLDNVSPVPHTHTLKVTSTNLFNSLIDFKSSTGATVSYEGEILLIIGQYTSKYITLEADKDYSFSCTSTRPGTSGGGVLLRAYTEDQSEYVDLYSASGVLSPSVTVHLPGGYPVLRITFYGGSLEETTPHAFTEIMLNAGTEPLEYVPWVDTSVLPVRVCGKNLFNIGTSEEEIAGSATLAEKTDDQITVKQTAAGTFKYVAVPIPDCKGLSRKSVTISAKIKTSGANKGCLRLQWASSSGTATGGYVYSAYITSPDDFAEVVATLVVPVQSNLNYDRLSLLLYSNTNVDLEEGEYTATYKDIQIEFGNNATEFEAYKPSIEYVAGEASRLMGPTSMIIVGGATTIEAAYNKDILGIAPEVEIGYVEGTIRQYLGWIAGLAGKNAKFNRRGKLRFQWYDPTDQMVAIEQQYLGGFKKLTESTVEVQSISSGTSDNVIVSGNGTGFSFENPFMTQDILDGIFDRVSLVRYTPSEVKWRGNPSIEAGDIVLAEDKEGNFHTVYVMEQTLKISGGLHSQIKCFGKSEEAIQFDTSPTAKKIQQVYTNLQNAIKDATALLNGANGGVFEITDDNGDGVNDGWVIHSLDELQQVFANVNGIGVTTDGRATVKEAITPKGIVASAITVGKLKADMIAVGDYDEENPDTLGDVFLVERDDEGHPVVTIGASNSSIKQKQTNSKVEFVNNAGEQLSEFSPTGASWSDMQQIKYCGFAWTKSQVTGNVRFSKVKGGE